MLAQSLVEHDGHGIAQVERARALDHRDAHAAVVVVVQQFLGQAARLLAKDQKGVLGILGLRVGARRLGGGVEELRVRVFMAQLVKGGVLLDGDQVSVVQPGPADLLFVDGKAQRMHQMQRGVRGGAGAGDVAGVLRDLGFDQYDMQRLTPLFYVILRRLPPWGAWITKISPRCAQW